MRDPKSYIGQRAADSIARLDQFKGQLGARVPDLKGLNRLCIYTTGSYGRHEANTRSDLDLFFVRDNQPISGLKTTLITADLIRLSSDLGFPDFDGDGAYLKIHEVESLALRIGHQQEDAENTFTARMLLMLESEPLHNAALYERAIRACLKEYCRDNRDNFTPRFLANDIMRYWKTLCLNYENKRTGRGEDTKAKARVKNFKLKHSRILICFSMVVCLCDEEGANSPDKLYHLVRMKPIDRLEMIAGRHNLTGVFGQIEAEYEWFLKSSDQNNAALEAWITENKGDVLRRASQFGDAVFSLLEGVAKATSSNLRYLLV